MKYTVDLGEKKVFGPYQTDITQAPSASLAQFVDSVKDKYPFSSGLLPLNGTGLLSIQRGFGFEQIIYQLAPAVDTVSWGARESTVNKALYSLAVPYRVYIADFKNGGFIGCRHFFSPEPIYSWDQQLYVPNLPNTNCIGYNGTSVGWVCLYHRHDTTKFTLSERIEYFLNRMNGVVEPYNDANMSETDGVRFYQNQGAPSFMWDAKIWQKKSLEEGFQWTLDPALYIPFEVDADPKHHAQSFMDKAPAYTLRRAAFEPYSAHYHDKIYQKPWMIADFEQIPYEMLASTYMGSGAVEKVVKAPKAPETPEELLKYFSQDVPGLKMKDQEAVLNSLVAVKTYKCPSCNIESKDYLISLTTSFMPNGLNIVPESTQGWCNACIEQHTTHVSSHYKLDEVGNIVPDVLNLDYLTLRVPKNILHFDEQQNVWYPPAHSVSCQSCGKFGYHNNKQNFDVYHYVKDTDTYHKYGCIGCVAAPYAKDYTSKNFVLIENMQQIEISNLEFVDGSEKPNFVQSTVYTTKPITQCACKLLTLSKDYATDELNEYGGLGNICAGCLTKDPDTNQSVYNPIFNLAEIPVTPII